MAENEVEITDAEGTIDLEKDLLLVADAKLFNTGTSKVVTIPKGWLMENGVERLPDRSQKEMLIYRVFGHPDLLIIKAKGAVFPDEG